MESTFLPPALQTQCPFCGWLPLVDIHPGCLTFCENPLECGALLATPLSFDVTYRQLRKVPVWCDFALRDVVTRIEREDERLKYVAYAQAARQKMYNSRGASC